MKTTSVPSKQRVLKELDALIKHYRSINETTKSEGIDITKRVQFISAVEQLKEARKIVVKA